MKNLQSIEIPFSKAKLIKLLIYCCLFFAGGLWLLLADPQTSNPFLNNIIIKYLVSGIAIIFSILGFIFFIKKLINKRPAIILNEEGIFDNSSAFSFGMIPWKDITKVYEKTIKVSIFSKEKFVSMDVKNPENYIEKESNQFKKKMLKTNAYKYGSLINISTNGIQYKHKDLLNLISMNFEHFK